MNIGIQFEAAPGTFDKVSDELTTALLAKIDGLSNSLAELVRTKVSGVSLQIRSGRLLESVGTVPAAVADGIFTAAVTAGGPAAPHAEIQEIGVGHAWEIVVADRKALRFMLLGEPRFAMKVQHGPLEARHFMMDSAEEMQEEIYNQLNLTISEVTNAE
jgi:hypothetical protein